MHSLRAKLCQIVHNFCFDCDLESLLVDHHNASTHITRPFRLVDRVIDFINYSFFIHSKINSSSVSPVVLHPTFGKTCIHFMYMYFLGASNLYYVNKLIGCTGVWVQLPVITRCETEEVEEIYPDS